MKHKLIFLLIGLALLGTAVYFYIDTVFLPIQLKQYVIAKAEKYLHRRVAIETIDFKPFKGFIIDNITVAQKNDPAKPFIRIKQVTFNLLLAPFFQRKAVIIPNIRIKDPFVFAVRDKKGNWNFSDLPDIRKAAGRRNVPAVLLRKFSLENGEIAFLDEPREGEFMESVKAVYLNTTLSLNKGIRFVGKAEAPKSKSVVRVKGNYNLFDRQLTAQVLLDNIHLARYLSLAGVSQPYVHLTGGVVSSADIGLIYNNRELRVKGAFVAEGTDVRIGGTKQISGTIHVPDMFLTWRGQKWDAKGRVEIPSARLSAASGKTFEGDITADLNLLTVSGENITSQGNVTVGNAHLKIGEHKYLKGNIKAANASLSKMNDTIRLQGDIGIEKAMMSVDEQTSIKGNLATSGTKLTWGSPDGRGNRRLDVQTGLTMDPADIMLGTNRSAGGILSAPKVNLVYDRGTVSVDTQGRFQRARIRLDARKTFAGDPHFNITYRYDPENTNPHDTKGSLHFTKGLLTGVPALENIGDVEGIVTFTPRSARTERLTFRAQETDILLSGFLEDFTAPKLNIKASSSDIRIEKILTLFPALREAVKADITGQAGIQAAYKGAAHTLSGADIEATARLSDVNIAPDGLDNDITDVFGRFDYKKDLAVWQGLNAKYKDNFYILNGQMTDFSRPVIDTKIVSEHANLITQIKLLNQAFRLTVLTGSYFNSNFDLKGDVHLFEDASADIDLRGKFVLDLSDIGALIPRLRDTADQLKPAGTLAGEGIYKGKLDDWRNWQLSLDATSDRIMVRGCPFGNVSLRFEQRDRNVSKFNILSAIYGGELKIDSSADLREEQSSFTSAVSLKNLDLERLRKDRNTKNRQLAGNLTFAADLNGRLEQWRQMTGEGSLEITGGHLWKWDILDGISKILLIPEFKTMVFTEAHGDFFVRNQKIRTENARMLSTTTTLDGKGWIDFKKNLNFNITPNFSELAIHQSGSTIKKGPTSILTQTKGYLNIHLTGTLDDPKLSVQKFPLKIIEETIGGTTDTLKEVIGGIVDEIF